MNKVKVIGAGLAGSEAALQLAKRGINVSNGNILNIYGQENGTGTLTATGIRNAAGIGGEQNEAGGTIMIDGGTVNATGGIEGAGIGGGYLGDCGKIIINGGTVSATGGTSGAGIGGGYRGAGGTVTVNGGIVSAYGKNSGNGIGAGKYGTENGSLKVSTSKMVRGYNDFDPLKNIEATSSDDEYSYYDIRKVNMFVLVNDKLPDLSISVDNKNRKRR